LHNRSAGRDTGWRDLFEAALVSYRDELRREASELPTEARAVLERDGWRCRVPGCSRRAMLELHHAWHRSQGGGDGSGNLVTLCRSHHDAHHTGRLEIAGSEPSGWAFRHRADPDQPWQAFPTAADGPYDPLERAWDGPTYVREPTVTAYVFKTSVTSRPRHRCRLDRARASP